MKKVEQLQSGQASGIDSVWRYCWQGNLPYQLVFDVRATRIEPMLAIEGSASGDLEGTGRWLFSSEGAVSVVRYEWQVRRALRPNPPPPHRRPPPADFEGAFPA